MAHGLKKAIDFYLNRGWNIIPCDFKKAVLKNGKIEKQVIFPLDYKPYHKEKVTQELAEKWWGDHNGIAIITGEISGITVMDIDTKVLPEIKDLPMTFTVETNKGFHFYFKYTDKVITNANQFKKGDFAFNIDIRNMGGIIYAAPCEYELPNGEMTGYKVIQNEHLTEFPMEWLQKIYENYEWQKKGIKEKGDWKNKLLLPLESGSRNMDFTSIIGGLLSKFTPDDWDPLVWPLVKEHNFLQKNPLEESELKTIFRSIAQKEILKRNISGDIKDVSSEENENEIRVTVSLENLTACFKMKNIASSLLEGTVITWLKRQNGLSHEIPVYLKMLSDTSKEQWVRILGRAFDKTKNENPWTLITAKAVSEFERVIRSKKQDFDAETAIAKEVSWLYEPFIQEDQINTFFGLGSSGKTLLSLYLATEVAREKAFNVLFIDYENDLSSWVAKLRQMLNGKETSFQRHFVYFDSEQIPIAEQIEKIQEVIRRKDIKLVIVDSASMASGESTSDEKGAIRLIAALKLLKITVVLIAHQRKNNGENNPIGSIQYENQARNVWNFKSEPDMSEESTLHVVCKHTKANNTFLRKNPIGFRIEFGDIINISREDAGDYFEDKLPVGRRIERLLSSEGGLGYKEIANKLGISDGTANKNLSIGKYKGIFNSNEGKWSLNPLDK